MWNNELKSFILLLEHRSVAPNIIGFNIVNGIFFTIACIAKLFWVLPMIKRWVRIWYLIGIGGTIILITLWAITRMPGNLITGRRGPLNEIAMAIVFQIAYVVITAIIIAKVKANGKIRKIV